MWSDAALPSYVLKPRDLQIVKKFSAWHEFLSSLQSSCHFRSFCCFKNQELLLWYHFITIIMFINFNNQFWKKRILNLLSIFMSFPLVLLFLWSRIITLISFHTIIILTESNNQFRKKEFWFFSTFISFPFYFSTNKNYYFDIIS